MFCKSGMQSTKSQGNTSRRKEDLRMPGGFEIKSSKVAIRLNPYSIMLNMAWLKTMPNMQIPKPIVHHLSRRDKFLIVKATSRREAFAMAKNVIA